MHSQAGVSGYTLSLIRRIWRFPLREATVIFGIGNHFGVSRIAWSILYGTMSTGKRMYRCTMTDQNPVRNLVLDNFREGQPRGLRYWWISISRTVVHVTWEDFFRKVFMRNILSACWNFHVLAYLKYCTILTNCSVMHHGRLWTEHF